MAVYIGLRMFGGFHVGLSSCLPADFPEYPHKTLASIVISDAFGDCTIQYRTRDSAAEVETFFETNLNEGDWTVTDVDSKNGMVQFQRKSKPRTRGYVKVLSVPGTQTQFQIQVRSR